MIYANRIVSIIRDSKRLLKEGGDILNIKYGILMYCLSRITGELFQFN